MKELADDNMDILDELRDYCEKNLTLYAFADISEYKDVIISEDLYKYDYAISMGLKIDDETINNLDSDEGRLAYLNAYVDANNRLDEISEHVEKLLVGKGFDARAVNASYILPDDRLVGEISHKFVANLAGLGWIGKSCLLITPEYGPRLRWVTVLTNMKLPVENRRLNCHCGSCNLCVKNCPVNAFKDVEFNEQQPRETRYDALLCKQYFDRLENEGKSRLCGICVKVCPWGNQKKQKYDIE